MAKRTATTELTDRNWDQEDEPEEAGVFEQASEDAMKGRKILTAKRRQAGDNNGSKPTAFAGFGGFAFKPTQTSTPLLGFGLKSESKLTTGKTEKPDDAKTIDSNKTDGKTVQEKNGSDARTNYLTHLKALNQSVTQWISQHVEKNPYCLLTPIFKDYEKHLAELERERDKPVTNGNTETSSKTEPMNETEDVKALPKTGLTFGMGTLKTENTVAAPTESTKPTFTGFSFTNTAASSTAPSTSGFTFAVGSTTASTSKDGDADAADEDEHIPPKVESVEHSEEGSLYSKKCKLFYQKEGAWIERGVGFLHLKQVEGKTQLLVRADTTLGNILLNIRLSESIPVSRQGKNNVSMMCIVNPEIPKVPTDKATPMLIRVKTALDADELLAKLKEMQN